MGIFCYLNHYSFTKFSKLWPFGNLLVLILYLVSVVLLMFCRLQKKFTCFMFY